MKKLFKVKFLVQDFVTKKIMCERDLYEQAQIYIRSEAPVGRYQIIRIDDVCLG